MLRFLLQLIDRVGNTTRLTLLTEMELVLFASTALRRGGRFIFQNEHNGAIRNAVVTQIIFSGVDSLVPTMLLMSVAIGFSNRRFPLLCAQSNFLLS